MTACRRAEKQACVDIPTSPDPVEVPGFTSAVYIGGHTFRSATVPANDLTTFLYRKARIGFGRLRD
jgi:hypothetical protein